jgi:hypothetical protein
VSATISLPLPFALSLAPAETEGSILDFLLNALGVENVSVNDVRGLSLRAVCSTSEVGADLVPVGAGCFEEASSWATDDLFLLEVDDLTSAVDSFDGDELMD